MPRRSSYSSYSSYLQNKTVTYGCKAPVEIIMGGTGGTSGSCDMTHCDPLNTSYINNSQNIMTRGLQIDKHFLLTDPSHTKVSGYSLNNLDTLSDEDVYHHHPHAVQMWVDDNGSHLYVEHMFCKDQHFATDTQYIRQDPSSTRIPDKMMGGVSYEIFDLHHFDGWKELDTRIKDISSLIQTVANNVLKEFIYLNGVAATQAEVARENKRLIEKLACNTGTELNYLNGVAATQEIGRAHV